MKILYAHLYNAKYKIGGAEKVLYDIAHAMKTRFEIKVSCAVNAGDLSEMLRQIGIPVIEIQWSKLQTLKSLWQIQKAINTYHPDIIHSHHRYMTFLLDTFFKKDARILHTEHVLRRDKRYLFRYGHLATAVHETVRQNLIDYFKVPADCVVTIPNAVAMRPCDREKIEKIRQGYAKKTGDVAALCIGRFETQKGHRYLVEALSLMPLEYRMKFKVFLAGDGVLRDSLKAMMIEKGVLENFIFLGHTGEIPEYLSFCDFLILPSLWEGMPLSVLEAYAAGKTVIATDIAGTRQLVMHGQTGLLVPAANSRALKNAIIDMMDHPEKSAFMAGEAHAWCRREFSFEQMTDRYWRLYEGIL